MQTTLKGTRSRITLLTLLVAAAYFTLSFGQQAVHNRELRQRVDQLRQENSSAQALNTKLQAELDQYVAGGNLQYAENRARNDLGMARPGDTVIVPVVADAGASVSSSSTDTSDTGASTADKTQPVSTPIWQRWVKLVFGGQ